jgi:hypothetical protein
MKRKTKDLGKERLLTDLWASFAWLPSIHRYLYLFQVLPKSVQVQLEY